MGMISVGRDNWRDLSVEVGITAVRTEEFVMIRQLLEMFKDFLILAEVCVSLFFPYYVCLMVCLGCEDGY